MTTSLIIAKKLGVQDRHVCLVGSTLICGSGNDFDFLCLVEDEDAVKELGFVPDIEVSYESPLRSYRRDNVNLIVTVDPNFFFAEVAIAHAAKAIATQNFDMGKREERIAFHSQVRESVLWRLHDVEGIF
jgi:hypothetical protein